MDPEVSCLLPKLESVPVLAPCEKAEDKTFLFFWKKKSDLLLQHFTCVGL